MVDKNHTSRHVNDERAYIHRALSYRCKIFHLFVLRQTPPNIYAALHRLVAKNEIIQICFTPFFSNTSLYILTWVDCIYVYIKNVFIRASNGSFVSIIHRRAQICAAFLFNSFDSNVFWCVWGCVRPTTCIYRLQTIYVPGCDAI